MCTHLIDVEEYLKLAGVSETWRGQPWSENCREWIYYNCVMDAAGLKDKLQLEDFVMVHDFNDPKAGSELGLVCEECDDAVIGVHPESSMALMVPHIG